MTHISPQFTTKGLFTVPHGPKKFRVVDIHGTSTLPVDFQDTEDFKVKLYDLFRIKPLIPIAELQPLAAPHTFGWSELEFYYVAHLDYSFKRYLMTESELETYYQYSWLVPAGYAECGHGQGARTDFEKLDKTFRASIRSSQALIKPETLETWLVLFEFSRVCSEVMSLLHRAISAFHDLLIEQRNCIADATFAIAHMNPKSGNGEVANSSKSSYRAASAAVASAISLCTSLDILSKLIFLIDAIDRDKLKYKPVGGKEFSGLLKNFKKIPKDIPQELMDIRGQDQDIMQLIQFRHDSIHSSAVLDLEKVFAGVGTGEINEATLHYSYQPWRDCIKGQPDRYLGREYFISENSDMEYRIFTWIHKVVSMHLTTGKKIHDFFNKNAKARDQ